MKKKTSSPRTRKSTPQKKTPAKRIATAGKGSKYRPSKKKEIKTLSDGSLRITKTKSYTKNVGTTKSNDTQSITNTKVKYRKRPRKTKNIVKKTNW